MIESNERYHVIVIGGSFAGLAAAIQLGRARRRVLVVDAGKPRNRFAPASHGFPGQDGRPPAEILETFRAQVLAYPTVSFFAGEATDARADGEEGFLVSLDTGADVRARRLILATGIVDELPEVPGLRERWGVSVLHCPYCHGYEVRERRIGVLSTGEMAVHQALLLGDWSADVTLFTNEALVPTAEQRAALEARGVRLVEGVVAAVEGEGLELSGVRLRGGALVEVDALFTASRTRLTSRLPERLGCVLEDGPFGPIVTTDANRETTVRGVYCAGDAARARHNATWAAADGVTAGVSAHQSMVFPPSSR